MPILTDDQYDAIFGESSTVGCEVGDTPHAFQMYSLQKHYKEDGEPPLKDTEHLVDTPKLDGCASSIMYNYGMLTRGLTRGNGKLGQVITDKMELLVPTKLITELKELPLVQIIGEVVSLAEMENSRNYSAGALSLKDINEFKEKMENGGTIFVAYGIQVSDQFIGLTPTYVRDMEILEENGFKTVTNAESLSRYPTDGKVLRVNCNKRFTDLGHTSKHPRGAYAFKEKQKPVVTTLKEVVWQTGKSGKVTPVALLEPVEINGAVIQRATLNNMAYIDALGLTLGCPVEVIRAGEIIPCIVGRAD